MKNGDRTTSNELREKIGMGTMAQVSYVLSTIKQLKAGKRTDDTSPATYEKIGQFRAIAPKQRAPKNFNNQEFTAIEIGQGVMAYIEELNSTLERQKKAISALKSKVNELQAENEKLIAEAKRTKNNQEIMVRKQNGETMRFSTVRPVSEA
jgi:hypothetical protein